MYRVERRGYGVSSRRPGCRERLDQNHFLSGNKAMRRIMNIILLEKLLLFFSGERIFNLHGTYSRGHKIQYTWGDSRVSHCCFRDLLKYSIWFVCNVNGKHNKFFLVKHTINNFNIQSAFVLVTPCSMTHLWVSPVSVLMSSYSKPTRLTFHPLRSLPESYTIIIYFVAPFPSV